MILIHYKGKSSPSQFLAMKMTRTGFTRLPLTLDLIQYDNIIN